MVATDGGESMGKIFLDPAEVDGAGVNIRTVADALDAAANLLAAEKADPLLPRPDADTFGEDVAYFLPLAADGYHGVVDEWHGGLTLLAHAIRTLGDRARDAAAQFQGQDQETARQWLAGVTGDS
jgi:hypothetical protein